MKAFFYIVQTNIGKILVKIYKIKYNMKRIQIWGIDFVFNEGGNVYGRR